MTSEKIVMGSEVIEMEIWPVGPGYTEAEREEMRTQRVGAGLPVYSGDRGRPYEKQVFPAVAMAALMGYQAMDPGAVARKKRGGQKS